MYNLLHIVQFGPVLKYRLCVLYRMLVTVHVAEVPKAPGWKPSCLKQTPSGPPLSVPVGAYQLASAVSW